MKEHTLGFKQELIKMGKEIDSIITYENTTLHDELYAVTPLFEANILKSVMKELHVESSVDIPLNTIINYQLGVKVSGVYEYLDFGNYVVIKSEKKEDTNTYEITCYDKMVYAMKDYDEITGTYPMSIREYLTAVCSKIGLTLKVTNFYNYALEIQTDLYKGLGYTYRDVLDEIAQATGSMIIINNSDLVEVKYPTITNDTIDENYLKDVNVKFGKKFGPVNTIVLSRSAGSDNIYYPSPLPANPIAIKIEDNQIMNFNDRADYLPGLYNALNGLEYYINDFSSGGILYYEVGDFYNVSIDNTSYKCLMLNDEINITSGIEELIHIERPKESETDYKKADKTDRRINQTYLMVDKQNRIIQSVITNVGEQDQKISQITQTVDELAAQISDIADITTYGESSFASVTLDDVNESEPIMLKVHPTTESIRYLHPRTTLYPGATQYLKNRNIKFTRSYTNGGNTLTEDIYYELPGDLLYYDSETYDEFYLDYESQTCQIIKRCGYNADGSVNKLATERIDTYPYPSILLGEGNYTISIPSYEYGYLYVRLMAKNIYTTQFYTKVETNSLIQQTTSSINLSVNQKLTNYSTTNEMNSAINIKANEITTSVSETYATKSTTNSLSSRITQNASAITSEVSRATTAETKEKNRAQGVESTLSSRITQNASSITAEVSRAKGVENGLSAKVELKLNTDDLVSELNASADRITLTAGRLVITSGNFKLNASGNITAIGGQIGGVSISSDGLFNFGTSNYDGFGLWKKGVHSYAGSSIIFHAGGNNNHIGDAYVRILANGKMIINGGSENNANFQVGGTTNVQIIPGEIYTHGSSAGIYNNGTSNSAVAYLYTDTNGGKITLGGTGGNITMGSGSNTYIDCTGIITARDYHYMSDKRFKSNIEVFNKKAINLIKNTKVYTYNFKNKKEKDIGFVVGKGYNCVEDIVGKEKGYYTINSYKTIAILWKAIQEILDKIGE